MQLRTAARLCPYARAFAWCDRTRGTRCVATSEAGPRTTRTGERLRRHSWLGPKERISPERGDSWQTTF
jgi:hypothetical protein